MSKTRRGGRSSAAKRARLHAQHVREVDAAIRTVARERAADAAHDRAAERMTLRGVGVVTRGLAVPPRGSVTRAPVGQWQTMAPDAPIHFSEERTDAWYRDRARERAATRASNDLLAADRVVQQVEAIADALPG